MTNIVGLVMLSVTLSNRSGISPVSLSGAVFMAWHPFVKSPVRTLDTKMYLYPTGLGGEYWSLIDRTELTAKYTP